MSARVPLSEITQILAELAANAVGDELEILVADDLRLNGQPIPFDLGIAIVIDAALGEATCPRSNRG